MSVPGAAWDRDPALDVGDRVRQAIGHTGDAPPLEWMPLYVDDYLSSLSVAALTPGQELAFLRFLMFAWKEIRAGVWCSLPDDALRLAQLSRLGPAWDVEGPGVLALFRRDVDGTGTARLRHPKLWALWLSKQSEHAKRSFVGRSGAAAAARTRALRASRGPEGVPVPETPPRPATEPPRSGAAPVEGERTEDPKVTLARAANQAVTETIGEQPDPYVWSHTGTVKLWDACASAGIPIAFAAAALADATRKLVTQRKADGEASVKPTSLFYFAKAVRQAWDASTANADAASGPAAGALPPSISRGRGGTQKPATERFMDQARAADAAFTALNGNGVEHGD